MQSAKLTTHKRISRLHRAIVSLGLIFTGFQISVSAQDNSPFSRYGIGNLTPSYNIVNRGMGGITAGWFDENSINLNNPASYSFFQSSREQKSKKLTSGRAVLDIGTNFDRRVLSEPGNTNTFKTNNAMFSYVQVGMPLRQNWGISFGLRPVSRIEYKVLRKERLFDSNTGLPIDSAETIFEGNGGAYLPSIGTGFSIFQKTRKFKQLEKLSVGINMGYLFGEKDYSARRTLINDSVEYYQSNHTTQVNFNGLYFGAGIQYLIPVKQNLFLTLGAFGNWGQNLDATRDLIRETFLFDDDQGNLRLDSVSEVKAAKGVLRMPASYTFGFLMQKYRSAEAGGWIFGADFSTHKWSEYRLYGEVDSVRNNWDLKIGAQLSPQAKRNYFSNVDYRVGLSLGPDYLRVGEKFNVFSASFGLALPVAVNRNAIYQRTKINLAFEYSRRGNDNNVLKESLYRLSLGFSFSDLWFIKRRYD
jgi:hypothetical protein